MFCFLKKVNLDLLAKFLLSLHNAQCRILPKIWPILPCFSQQNWRVIFEVFQSNFGFAWLNSTVRSLVWENEWNNWETFTSSLRSHNFISDNISGKIRHCALEDLHVCMWLQKWYFSSLWAIALLFSKASEGGVKSVELTCSSGCLYPYFIFPSGKRWHILSWDIRRVKLALQTFSYWDLPNLFQLFKWVM